MKHNSIGDDIPIVIVLKAMGLECDQEIVQLIGSEPGLRDLFSGSLEEPYNLGIFNKEHVSCSIIFLLFSFINFLLYISRL